MSNDKELDALLHDYNEQRWRAVYFTKKPIQMEIREETRQKMESQATLVMEIDSLAKIVAKRDEWLNNPDNRMRRTYEAVAQDTNQLRKRLEFKKSKLNK